VQTPQIAQQRRFRDGSKVEHGPANPDLTRHPRRPERDHIAVCRRMQCGGSDLLAQVTQRGPVAVRRGDRDWFAIQADNPREGMRQHGARQRAAAFFRPRECDADHQALLRRRRTAGQSKYAGISAGATVGG